MGRALQIVDNTDLSQHFPDIQVATPCDEKWENMRGDERVRRCDACALNVYNLAGMSNVEIHALFQESEGRRVCGRVYRRKDGTVITADCPVGLAEKAWRHARNGTLTAAASVLTLVAFLVGALAFLLRGPPEPTGTIAEEIIDVRDDLLDERDYPVAGGLKYIPPEPEQQPEQQPTP